MQVSIYSASLSNNSTHFGHCMRAVGNVSSSRDAGPMALKPSCGHPSQAFSHARADRTVS